MPLPGAVPAPSDPLPRVADAVRQIFQFAAAQTAVDTVSSDLASVQAAEFIVATASGALSAERVLTDTATVTWDFSTPGQAKANAAGGGGGVVGEGLFAVNRNDVDQTGGTAGAYNKIQFTTELTDANGYFDNATNYRYLPTVAGLYLIALSVNSLTGTSGETCQAEIRMNGATAVARSTYFGSSSLSEATWQVFNVINFNGSTDYVEGYIYLPAAVTTFRGLIRATNMWGMRLA